MNIQDNKRILLISSVFVIFACSTSMETTIQPTYTYYPTYTLYPTYTKYITSSQESNPKETKTIISSNNKIPDLAYIKIFALPYSDDADPEYEGISIDISYFDTKSELIEFHNVIINVNIIIIGYRDALSAFDKKNGEEAFNTTIQIDHSMNLEELFGKYIRISYSDMKVNKEKYYQYGTIKVIVKTPQQGEFESESDLPIELYP